jgi:hypothetical protein
LWGKRTRGPEPARTPADAAPHFRNDLLVILFVTMLETSFLFLNDLMDPDIASFLGRTVCPCPSLQLGFTLGVMASGQRC